MNEVNEVLNEGKVKQSSGGKECGGEPLVRIVTVTISDEGTVKSRFHTIITTTIATIIAIIILILSQLFITTLILLLPITAVLHVQI